jgi:hypothetical protein
MKITSAQLRQIIREELERVQLEEGIDEPYVKDAVARHYKRAKREFPQGQQNEIRDVTRSTTRELLVKDGGVENTAAAVYTAMTTYAPPGIDAAMKEREAKAVSQIPYKPLPAL